MSLQQRLAGNAHSSLPGTRGGASTRMRTFISIITALAALAVPAVSSASDPILSGYGGPGNAEQAVLGAQLADPPSSGPGSGGAGATADDSLRASSSTSASSSSSSRRGSSGTTTTKRSSSSSTSSSATSSQSSPGSGPAATPATVAYPTREGGTGGLPLDGPDLGLALLAFVALVLGGLGLRRLAAATASDGPSTPQGASG